MDLLSSGILCMLFFSLGSVFKIRLKVFNANVSRDVLYEVLFIFSVREIN